ncbi:unnamed protein product [Cyprideis torosa]|uniref:histone deacetylase n=1 Tax=Cyprideis torosa TaxID=163714 RepID=A0A7R8W5U2_9CRUS|nr:unnamed protein product [Cyprideis torosa]CAG0884696.1 unnamed protein product [Cyprideis torosa]
MGSRDVFSADTEQLDTLFLLLKGAPTSEKSVEEEGSSQRVTKEVSNEDGALWIEVLGHEATDPVPRQTGIEKEVVEDQWFDLLLTTNELSPDDLWETLPPDRYSKHMDLNAPEEDWWGKILETNRTTGGGVLSSNVSMSEASGKDSFRQYRQYDVPSSESNKKEFYTKRKPSFIVVPYGYPRKWQRTMSNGPLLSRIVLPPAKKSSKFKHPDHAWYPEQSDVSWQPGNDENQVYFPEANLLWNKQVKEANSQEGSFLNASTAPNPLSTSKSEDQEILEKFLEIQIASELQEQKELLFDAAGNPRQELTQREERNIFQDVLQEVQAYAAESSSTIVGISIVLSVLSIVIVFCLLIVLGVGSIIGGLLCSGAVEDCCSLWVHSALRRCYEDELYPPLRKTASEPNLKIRLKQRLERSSPLRARTRTPTYPKDLLKRRAPHNSSKSESSAGSTPDSGPSSPPSVANPISQSSSGSTVQEEMSGHDSGYGGCVPPPDLTNHPLFTSPSLPNISLGRPPGASLWAAQEGPKLPTVSETSPRMPIPLQIANMYFNSSSDSEQSTSPSTIQKQVEILEQQGQQIMGATGFYPTGPITDAEVAQARLAKTSPRPLNRTHSAPLPLGHPMLQPGAASIAQLQAQYEQILREQLQHSLLKQQLRATVLTRAGHLKQQSSSPSSSQICSSSSDEEHHSGAAKHQHPPLPHPEVIDLTECGHSSAARSSLPSSPPTGSRRLSRHSSEDNQGIGSHSPPQTSRALSAQQRNSLSRPLSRALSSPLVNMISPPTAGTIPGLKDRQHAGGTGIAFDPVMLKHGCVCGNNAYHPEHSGRLQSAWARLQDTTLLTRCERLRPRKATMEELQTCHTEAHTLIFGTSSLSRQGKMDISQPLPPPLETGFVYLPCGGVGVDSDTTWDELHTSTAARTAAGCTVELAMKVAMGELRNGFALVRPPGHHAEPEQAMGFCYFNNIAIAAKQLRCRLRMERILIVDWDVHHGNGTQSIFYADHHVLVISIHRYDDGNFFPGTGGPVECGVGDGLGFNVNIPWAGNLNPPCGDAEYLAAFRAVVMPIAKEFNPEIVLVSAGFDAVRGHPAPLGGYEVSPACFAFLTRQLQQLANGKVVLVLEGGYDLLAVCDCVQECVSALLGDPLPPIEKSELAKKPSVAALETLQKTIAIQSHHWPLLRSFAYCVDQSALEAMTFDQARMEKLLSIGVDSETCNAMASLSVDPMDMKRSEAMEEGGGFGVCGSPGPSDQSIPSGSTEEPMEDDSKD